MTPTENKYELKYQNPLGESCEVCKFYQPVKDDFGYCRFAAPIILPALNNKTGHFPIINEANWCGDGICAQSGKRFGD